MARTKNGLNKDDRSPIEIFVDAIQKNDIKKVEQMIKEGININEAYNWNTTPFSTVVETGNMEIFNLLLKNGLQLNSVEDRWTSPLYVAAEHGRIEFFPDLVNAGCDVNRPSQYDKLTPLHASCKGKYFDCVDYLLSVGAKPDIADRKGVNALMLACSLNSIDLVQKILDFGVDINKQDNDGWTPLIYAVMENNYDLVQLLLSKGADQSIVSDVDYTALTYAATMGYDDILQLLITNGGNVYHNTEESSSRYALDITITPSTKTILSKEMNWVRRRNFLIFLYQSNILSFQSETHPISNTPQTQKLNQAYLLTVLSNRDLIRYFSEYL